MRQCNKCQAQIKGDWASCPLCGEAIDTNQLASLSSYPDVPLQFNRQSITRLMIGLSIVMLIAIGILYQGKIQWVEATLFAIMTMWLAILILIRKRRNIAKSLLYLLVILSLLCIYLDYLIGWDGWSISLAIPIICSSTLISMFITTRLTYMNPGDYVLYLAAAEILSLTPIVFLLLGWVKFPIPSLISFSLGLIMLIFILVTKGPIIWREIKKRTFI